MAETQGSYEIDIREVEYLRHGGTAYSARLFQPRGPGPFPAVIEAHGGAWCQGNWADNDAINHAVASGGVVVAALEFRHPPEASYPGSVADINYAIRWLKSRAAEFKSAPELVGAMGTSSSGHLVILAALKPEDPRYRAIPLPGTDGIDAQTPYVVALWPVICPASRYRVLKARLARDPANESAGRMIGQHDKYWISEEAMAEGSPNLILAGGEAVALPGILYLQNPVDHLHPRAHLESFTAGYRKAGGKLELAPFEGERYDHIRTEPTSPSARRAFGKIIAFIHAQAGAREDG